jgi:hypothetical protein
MNRKLWQFHWNCGRMGDLNGLFVATNEEVEKTIGKFLYFGEVLGKHSEVQGDLERKDIEIVSDDQEFIDKFIKNIGQSFGFNPLIYIYKRERDERDNDLYLSL